MDFIMSLPWSIKQHDSILVIVDKITKLAHFLLVKMTHIANDYARLYIREIVKIYGVSLSIILDRESHYSILEVLSERSMFKSEP